MGKIVFTFDGQDVAAAPGDSIAAALAACGETILGQRRNGHNRAAFCGMGVCHDCLVTVDGQRGQRACMVSVREAMTVQSESDSLLAADTVLTQRTAEKTCQAEIVVIGAGPAGLTAAINAARAGASVIVLDERSETGGQYFKPRSSGYRGHSAADRQHRNGTDLRNAALNSDARIFTGQTVWFARQDAAGFDLRSLGSDQSLKIRARAVIIATGAFERPAMVPGWTLPGVMTIGAAQTYARRYGVAPKGRLLIAGHGPLGLQLAAELNRLGGHVVALAERGRPRLGGSLMQAAITAPRLLVDGAGYWLTTKRSQTQILSGWQLSAVTGQTGVQGAIVENLRTGETKQFEVDFVIAGDGFAPQLEIARLLGVPIEQHPETNAMSPKRDPDGRTPVEGVWIAGDAGGLGGAEIAACQGTLSARGTLKFLGKEPGVMRSDARRRLQRAQRFQKALWRIYDAPERAAPQSNTVLCRCEGIRVATARKTIDNGARDPATLKRETRIGMGRCQGRYCLPQAIKVFRDAGHTCSADALFAPQIPARPVSIGAIGSEKAEWGGHRASAPSQRPDRPVSEPLGVSAADLVIVGGGVTGISAALYAARAGASVVCLDRGRVNAEASGGNAGSLHLQLLSWDFGGKAVGDGSLQLRTLPLQKEAIGLWRELEKEIGANFEMQVTGGLMVAETPEHLPFLEDKVRAEERVGIQSEVIDAARVKSIIPNISDNIIGAAWCPGEGKINPLTATPALARAARASGAIIEEFAPVSAIAREDQGYLLNTARGAISARRVLIAAGGWSTQIARMLGTDLPIRGAPLQMVVTAPAPPLVPCLLAHAGRHLTMKQAASGSIIIGGAWPATTGPSGYADVLPDSLEGSLWVAAHTVPLVGSLHMIRSWAAMNIDIDGAPLIGPVPGYDGVSVAATANGFTLGPLMGREAAAFALHGRMRQDLEAFSMARFQ
ncbi:MAG: FAD-dependent oxidoreductase [Pseudoprimorskyibacter sp.]|nr:FAD-dependent oxidoreductase [Pseudoprimorskyibacter sp.]